MKEKITLLIVLVFMAGLRIASGQPDDVENLEYWDVVSKRADNIVRTLELDDKEKALKVRDMIAMQYYNLNRIHDDRDQQNLNVIENDEYKDPEVILKRIDEETEKEIRKLHKKYLRQLSVELTDEQVDMVKDGMTYGVLERTYDAYRFLLPEITDVQKEKIMAWLVEAREIAMDMGSSEEKHAVFNKYKGKINNYLSDEGYDLKARQRDLEKGSGIKLEVEH